MNYLRVLIISLFCLSGSLLANTDEVVENIAKLLKKGISLGSVFFDGSLSYDTPEGFKRKALARIDLMLRNKATLAKILGTGCSAKQIETADSVLLLCLEIEDPAEFGECLKKPELNPADSKCGEALRRILSPYNDPQDIVFDPQLVDKFKSELVGKTIFHLDHGTASDSDIRALVEALQGNNTIQELHLEDNDIGIVGAQKLAEFLKNNNSLTLLNLSTNPIGDAGAKVLSEALHNNGKLETLLLENSLLTNAAVVDVAGMLKINKTLKNLSLLDNRSIKQGLPLAEALWSNNTLKSLKMGELEDAVDLLLASLQRGKLDLLQLDLYFRTLQAAIIAGKRMREEKFYYTRLKKLSLTNQHSEITDVLSKWLASNIGLIELSLNGRDLYNSQVINLFNALRTNTNLRSLELRELKLSRESAEKLLEVLNVNKTLLKINLETNDNSLAPVIEKIKKQLRAVTLKPQGLSSKPRQIRWDIAQRSDTIKNMIGDLGGIEHYSEQKNPPALPVLVSAQTLDEIFRTLAIIKDSPNSDVGGLLRREFPPGVYVGRLKDFLLAANYLGIPYLIQPAANLLGEDLLSYEPQDANNIIDDIKVEAKDGLFRSAIEGIKKQLELITLKAEDNQDKPIQIYRGLAEMSKTLRDAIGDIGAQEAIPVAVNSRTLNAIISSLVDVRSPDEKIFYSAIRSSFRSAASLEDIKNFLLAANYLDIEKLIKPVAQLLIDMLWGYDPQSEAGRKLATVQLKHSSKKIPSELQSVLERAYSKKVFSSETRPEDAKNILLAAYYLDIEKLIKPAALQFLGKLLAYKLPTKADWQLASDELKYRIKKVLPELQSALSNFQSVASPEENKDFLLAFLLAMNYLDVEKILIAPVARLLVDKLLGDEPQTKAGWQLATVKVKHGIKKLPLELQSVLENALRSKEEELISKNPKWND